MLASFFGVLCLFRNFGGSLPEGSRPALLEPAAHEGATALAFTNEAELLSVDSGGTLKRWDLTSGRARTVSLVGRGLYRKDTLGVLLDSSGSVCVSVVGGGDTCYTLDLTGGRSALRLGNVACADPTAGPKYLYGADELGLHLSVFQRGVLAPYRTVRAGAGWKFTHHASLSPDMRYAAALRKRPNGWEVLGGELRSGRWSPVEVLSSASDLQFSPDSGTLAWMECSDHGRTLQVRRVGSWKPEWIHTISEGPGLFRFSPDGRRIAVLEEVEREYLMSAPLPERRRDRVYALRIIAPEPPQVRPRAAAQVRGHAAQVIDCTWSPEARRIATLDEDGRIALWNTRTGRLEGFLAPRG